MGTRIYPAPESGPITRRGDTRTFVRGNTLPALRGVVAGTTVTVAGWLGAANGSESALTVTR